MTLNRGQTLQYGRYRIVDPLGQGGMGAVFVAADRNLNGHLVAIKENANITPQAQQQFEREALLLARLIHPNLPRVKDHFIEPGGRQYLVMDYVQGEDLQRLLRSNGFLPEGEVLSWIEQVMVALDYMHNWVDPSRHQPAPIIHRDIKPANIKRTPDGQIILVDFGLAKIADGSLTLSGARGYTPGYSPLEQYSGATDARSDIYSLGATLYALLTKQTPPEATLIAANNTLHWPRHYNPQITRNTERVILRAMTTQAAHRYATIAAMYQALFSRPLPATVHRATTKPRSAVPALPATVQRRNSNLWLSLLLLPILFLFVFIWQQSRKNSPLPPDAIGSSALTVTPTVSTDISTTTLLNIAQKLTVSLTENFTNTPSRVHPSAIQLPTVTLIPTVTPMPTDTPTPTVAPTSTPTFTPTPTVTPSETSTPARQRTTSPDFTNATVVLQEPPDAHTLNGERRFVWRANFALPTGYAFEPIFWRRGDDPMRDGRGYGGTTRESFMTLRPKQFSGTDDYRWGVRLVTTDPYKPIKYLGGDWFVRVDSGSTDGAKCGVIGPLGDCAEWFPSSKP